MDNNAEADNEVVAESDPVKAVHTEDLYYYVSTGKGEIFRCEISVEICVEERLEDRRCDLIIDLEEAIAKTMVGMYGLTQKTHISEYHGTFWAPDRRFMEES